MVDKRYLNKLAKKKEVEKELEEMYKFLDHEN